MALPFNLEQRDVTVMGGLLILLLGVSYIGHALSLFQQYGPQVELVLNIIVFLAGVVAIYQFYRSVHLFGGEVGRGLAMIGIGIGYLGLTAVAHIYMHLENPMALPFYTYMHTSHLWAFVLATYGFYLLYKGGMA